MAGLEQIRALYEYNQWANDHILDAASALSEDDLARDLGASFGSVRGNLRHLVWAQALWAARFAGGQTPEQPRLTDEPALAALREAYRLSHQSLRSFVETLDEGDLSRPVSYVDTQGRAQERPLWQVMLHLVNHGTNHRAETALLLSSLGKPPRDLDYVFFELERA